MTSYLESPGAIVHDLPLYTAAQMRRTDAKAIEGLGLPGVVLMERAGMAVAEYLLERFCSHHSFVVLAGKGNNGGDGFVVARHLHEAGAEVGVLATAAATEYRGDALVNLKILAKLSLKVAHAPGAAALRRALAGDAVIVDAILGTGFSGEPSGKPAQFIAAAAAAAERYGLPVVAVDIASGVDASSGEVAATALPADATVTFHAPKPGHFVAPGGYLAGDVILADIGIPHKAMQPADHFLTDPELLAQLLPPKRESDHKFSVGRVLLVGGSTGLAGAACLAAEAALKAGAGVVTAAVPRSLNSIFEQKLLEVMTLPLDDTGSGQLASTALARILQAANKADCLVIGPGLGQSAESAALVGQLLLKAELPVVLDADGLNAMAGKLSRLKKRRFPTVLTPHAGELGRLLDLPSEQVEARRLAAVKSAAQKSGAVVLLKGAATICSDGKATLVNPNGNPGLATAGSGDVLAGVIAALLAKGLDPLNAAAAGAFLHGSAADLAATEAQVDHLIASDLIDYLPRAFAQLREPERSE